jgi:formyl-CoA transferase
LIETGDVLLDNFRPGVLRRFNLNDHNIRSLNPKLIHCSITGFGPSGPYAGRPAYDAVAQALSGMSSLQIDPLAPQVTGPTLADNATGQVAAYGILAALFERERTGRARRVEVNMLDAALSFIPDAFSYFTDLGLVSDSHLRAHTSQSYVFRCRDDRMLAVHLSSQDKFWREFLTVLNLTSILEDPRFSTRSDRIDNYDELSRIVGPVIAERPLSAWVEQFADRDVPCAPVYDVTEVFHDPQVKYLQPFLDLKHPHKGTITSIRRPVWFDGQRDDQPRRAPPMLGEHTDEVLRELHLEVGA